MQNASSQLIPATSFPMALKTKGIFFVKPGKQVVPKINIRGNLIYGDLGTKPLEQLAAMVDEVKTLLVEIKIVSKLSNEFVTAIDWTKIPIDNRSI